MVAERDAEKLTYVGQRETWAHCPGDGAARFHHCTEKRPVGKIHAVCLVGRTQASLVKRLVVCDERQIAGHHRQAVPDTVECITFCRVIISYAVNLLGEISRSEEHTSELQSQR